MDEIISYKMCAVKVRNAKLRNYLKRSYGTHETGRIQTQLTLGIRM
jgi:hypothetical protein